MTTLKRAALFTWWLASICTAGVVGGSILARAVLS